jgi:hypothetical protein
MLGVILFGKRITRMSQARPREVHSCQLFDVRDGRFILSVLPEFPTAVEIFDVQAQKFDQKEPQL